MRALGWGGGFQMHLQHQLGSVRVVYEAAAGMEDSLVALAALRAEARDRSETVEDSEDCEDEDSEDDGGDKND